MITREQILEALSFNDIYSSSIPLYERQADAILELLSGEKESKLPRIGYLIEYGAGEKLNPDCSERINAIELTDEVRQLLSTGCAFTEGELVLEIEKAESDDVYTFSRGLAIALTQACQAKVAHLKGVIDEYC